MRTEALPEAIFARTARIFISIFGAVIFICMIFIARIYGKKKKAELSGEDPEYESGDTYELSGEDPGYESGDTYELSDYDTAPEDIIPEQPQQTRTDRSEDGGMTI